MAEAGWYNDPNDPSRMRYFDGEIWTEHYHDPQSAAAAAPGVAAAPGAAGAADYSAGGFSTGNSPGVPRTVQLTSVGDLLSNAWEGVKAKLGPLLGLTIGTAIAIGILYALFIAWVVSSVDDSLNSFDDFGDSIASFIVGYIVMLFLIGLIYSIYILMSTRMFHLYHRGHNASLDAAWSRTKERLWPFYGTAIVLYIGFTIGIVILSAILGSIAPALSILILVPTIFAWVKLGFLPIAAVATGRGQSMVSNSTGVSEGRFFPVFGRMLACALPLIAFYILGGIVFFVGANADSGPLALIGGVITLIGALVGGLIMASGLTRLYLDAGGISDI